MTTDHDDRYRFGYCQTEFERLGDQHQVWAGDNQRLLERAGFGSGATLVDLGCGPGFTTMDLARLVGPQGRVIAVDRDGVRSLQSLRKSAAAAGLENISTREVDLERFDLPESSVDGVYGRWVLMYLPERSAAELTRRIARWLRPGGACALAELCNYRHIHIHPPCPHLAPVAEALMRAVSGERGCNPEIGNRLPELLVEAGLDVEIHVNTKVVQSRTPQWLWPDKLFREHAPELVNDGYLAQEALDSFMTEWEQRSRDPGALFFGSPLMEVVGRGS